MPEDRAAGGVRNDALEPVRITPVGLDGLLGVPAQCLGVVLFAHGSGSGRFSPRNGMVAERLRNAGLATLLFDLLGEEEAADRRNVFDIGLLSGRLRAATEWTSVHPRLRSLPCGYFGASTGAAAALVAAACMPRQVAAVVSRGGRPDMAAGWLAQVECPTLLIVGERDTEVLSLNETALEMMRCERELRIVPQATHLFEEPGALDVVVQYSRDWFLEHLSGGM